MNLRFLRTMLAISDHPSFITAANSLGLSHSAVSLQVKALEEELQVALVDRSIRTPKLTDTGVALVEYARQILALTEEMRTLGHDDVLVGQMSIGVVPSALSGLIPPVLARLREAHPKLQVKIRSALSNDLALAVRSHELDLAVVTQPRVLPEGLVVQKIYDEPLDVIVPFSTAAKTDVEALQDPLIWFNRRTWAGQQIEEQLYARKITVHPVMEIDSIEAIESLVQHGLGVSITPRRFSLDRVNTRIRRIPFGQPQQVRTLSLISPERTARRRAAETFLHYMQELTCPA